jgi:hypothetical protein
LQKEKQRKKLDNLLREAKEKRPNPASGCKAAATRWEGIWRSLSSSVAVFFFPGTSLNKGFDRRFPVPGCALRSLPFVSTGCK